MDPLISLVVTSYNLELYIEDCLQSILPGLDQPVELLLVDDGSVDRTREIIQKFLGPKNIVYLCQPNAGQNAARNLALDHARGKFIWFIDGDDWLSEGAIARACDLVRNLSGDASPAFGSVTVMPDGIRHVFPLKNEPGKPASGVDLYLNGALRYVAWNKLLEKRVIDAQNLRFPAGIQWEMPFLTQYYLSSGPVQITTEVLYNYRVRPGSIITSGGAGNIRDSAHSIRSVWQVLQAAGMSASHCAAFVLCMVNVTAARLGEMVGARQRISRNDLRPLDDMLIEFSGQVLAAIRRQPVRVLRALARVCYKRAQLALAGG